MKMPGRRKWSDLYQFGTGEEVWMEKFEPEGKDCAKKFGSEAKACGEDSETGAGTGYLFHA